MAPTSRAMTRIRRMRVSMRRVFPSIARSNPDQHVYCAERRG